jgi:hypothetical protein
MMTAAAAAVVVVGFVAVMVMQTIPQSFPKVWVVRIADGGGPARQM